MSAHTPGPWHFNKYHGTPESIAECNKFGIEPVRALANDGSAFVMAGNGDDKTRVALVDCHAKVKRGHGHKTDCAERDANAALIAEAGTVANETGLSPRQLADALKEEKFERQQVCAALTREVIKTEKLADQRAKLLTACEELLLYEDYPHDIGNRDDAFYKIVELARAAVKAAKQVNP